MHPRLAFCAPLPPAKTGVATYSAAVLEGLRRIGFTERHDMDVVWPVEPKHEGVIPWYALGVYQLGNNVEFHRDLYRFACQAPGLIVLHDLALDDFVRGMKAAGDPLGYVAEREANRLRERFHSPDAIRNEPLREPWCGHVVRRSRGVVVHSEFGRRYLKEFGCKTPVFVVPHPVAETEGAMLRARRRAHQLRAPLEARGAKVVIGALGDLNEAKRLDAVLASLAQLDPGVHLALVGRRIEGYDVDLVVRESGAAERVTLCPDVSDDDFRAWLFASDLIVDLRHPTRGETSGTLARAMHAGRPSVVSATGAYLDAPEGTVLPIAPGPPEVRELGAAIGRLVEDPDLRARMGEAALKHAARLASTEAAARGYATAIEQTLELVRDPVRKAMARWGGALIDIGVEESMLREGYGRSYVRALEDLQSRPVAGDGGLGPLTGSP
jgi:glycosyltransferase involved in cell wall biosynthesis